VPEKGCALGSQKDIISHCSVKMHPIYNAHFMLVFYHEAFLEIGKKGNFRGGALQRGLCGEGSALQ
jgi:hypothetical protein